MFAAAIWPGEAAVGATFASPNAEDAGSPEKPSFSAEELGKAIMTAAGLDSKSQTGFCFRPPHLPQTGNWPHDGLNCSCGSQGESLGRLHCQSQQTTIYGMDSKLGKLTRVDLREIWKNEEYDFSNWLAGEENLIQLSDEIGISIRLIEKEAGVGKYSLDILAEEEGTGRKIIIEKPQRRKIGTTFQSRVPKLTSA